MLVEHPARAADAAATLQPDVRTLLAKIRENDAEGIAATLDALPNMKSITIEAGKLKLSAEPLPATGCEAAPVTAPESLNVPMLGTVAMTATETNQSAKV